jgi:hypothetical protein
MMDAQRGGAFARRARGAFSLAAVAVLAVWLGLPLASASAARSLSGTFVIAQGVSSTRTPDVTLDPRVRGATLMRFKNAGGAYSAWEPYTASRVWTLSPGDGLKTVEAQFKGVSGSRAVLLDDITLDTTGPATTSDYDGTPRRVVDVTLSSIDALSGVAETWYRVDGGLWREGVFTTLRIRHKRSGLAAGPHALEFYSIDGLGNVGPTGSSVITLQY